MVFAKVERTYVKVFADGSVCPATDADLEGRDIDPVAVERERCIGIMEQAALTMANKS
jgi:hypothetical protein